MSRDLPAAFDLTATSALICGQAQGVYKARKCIESKIFKRQERDTKLLLRHVLFSISTCYGAPQRGSVAQIRQAFML